jgi:hypothetical protein
MIGAGPSCRMRTDAHALTQGMGMEKGSRAPR